MRLATRLFCQLELKLKMFQQLPSPWPRKPGKCQFALRKAIYFENRETNETILAPCPMEASLHAVAAAVRANRDGSSRFAGWSDQNGTGKSTTERWCCEPSVANSRTTCLRMTSLRRRDAQSLQSLHAPQDSAVNDTQPLHTSQHSGRSFIYHFNF